MKLRAIRLKEFRRFTDPVAVEGLTGELDVLAAPNEDGKSTLFEAVRTVISEKHNAGARSKKMAAIQPYVGGAPLIEIDFDLGDKAYRLRKQFIKRPDAILIDLTTGRDIARKDDVEDWISDNLTGKLPFGLFWVAQHASLAPALTEKSPGEQISALRSIVEAEVGAIAGGEIRDKVRTSIAEELAALVTSRGPKKNGPFDLAVNKRDTINSDLEVARKRQADAEIRLSRLEELRAERRTLLESSEQAELGTRVRAAEDAVKQALTANAKLREARKEEETGKHQLTAVMQRLTEFDARAADFGQLTATQTQANEKAAAVAVDVRTARTSLDEATTRHEAATKDLKTLRAAEKAAMLAEQRGSLEASIKRKTSVMGEARATGKRIAETKTFLDAEAVTNTTLATLQAVYGDVAELTLKLKQQTPRVTVKYDKSAEGKISVGGQVLADGIERPINEKTELRIDGVGRLAVDPGDPSDRTDDADDLAALCKQRDDLMDTLGVKNLPEAQTRAAEREARATSLGLDETRLANLAPDGLKTLESTLAIEQKRLDDLPGVEESKDLRPRNDIAKDIVTREAQVTQLTSAVDEARQSLHALQVAEAEVRKDVANRADRLTALSRSLDHDAKDNPVGRDANRTLLAEAVGGAETRLSAAAKSVAGWLEAHVSDTALEEREQKLSEVRKEAEASQASVRRIEQEQGEIAAVLREVSHDGIDEVVGELEGALAHAEKNVAHYERRVEALNLLADTLDDVAEDTRQTYTQPIVKRLAPYLGELFPDAGLSFSQHFAADGINRDGVIEQFSDVSLGTQEQIGVLVRLGFARLFADRGQPLPLILDDALVYSDDERIERMFNALRVASQEHQVLVLTCRMRAFEGLGGNRVNIAPSTFE